MRINRKDLLNTLNKVSPGLSKDDFIEQTSSFIFMPSAIRTFNDQVSVICLFDSGLRGAVKSKEFRDLISRLPDEEIDLYQEKNKFIIEPVIDTKSESRKAEIYFEDVILPEIDLSDIKWYSLPTNIKEAISFCLFSTSKDMSIPYQNNIYVVEDKVISFDGYRGSIYNLDKKIKDNIIKIPAKTARELIRYDPEEYGVSESNFIHFKNEEGVIFSSKEISDELQNLDKFFNVSGNKVNLPEDFDQILNRVSVLAGFDHEGDQFMEICIKDNYIYCSGKGDVGKYDEKKRMRYKGEEIKFMTNPHFLKEIYNHTNTMVVGERLCFETENFKHVLLMSE